MYFQLYLHNLVEQFNKDTFVFNTRGGFRGGTGGARPVFLQSLVFCDHFEELQTVLIEVKLIINNAPLTYVYPNTIKTYLTPNHLLLGRQLLF